MDYPDIVEEFCNRPHLGPRHERHRWSWSGHRLLCLGYNPAAPELTVDLLIAKYEGRRLGLHDSLTSGRLTAANQAETLARADEVDRILTDLRLLRATQGA